MTGYANNHSVLFVHAFTGAAFEGFDYNFASQLQEVWQQAQHYSIDNHADQVTLQYAKTFIEKADQLICYIKIEGEPDVTRLVSTLNELARTKTKKNIFHLGSSDLFDRFEKMLTSTPLQNDMEFLKVLEKIKDQSN
ncbi:MAG: hypothetical protein KI790_19325 [Cyclobacteriaceae bacterium]|nr:hypothetical protein [Cyclobacteriaceae bacterium HetDA_MAG_MS6]